jgi:hypothetical protein
MKDLTSEQYLQQLSIRKLIELRSYYNEHLRIYSNDNNNNNNIKSYTMICEMIIQKQRDEKINTILS